MLKGVFRRAFKSGTVSLCGPFRNNLFVLWTFGECPLTGIPVYKKKVFVQAVRLPRNTVDTVKFAMLLSPGSLQTLEIFAASVEPAYEN